MNITTTANRIFSEEDSRLLAALVWRRYGYNTSAAAAAWRRLLQNDCPDEEFAHLANWGTSQDKGRWN